MATFRWDTAMDSETDEVTQELALLRARYAGYAKAAQIMRAIFMVLIPVLAVGAAVLAVDVFLSDVLYGVFLLAALLIAVAAITWFIKELDVRWIDLVSQSPRGIYSSGFFHPELDRSLRPRSDAEAIERQIAGRERRLTELQGSDKSRS
jgi:protein-S-isoprenylcysteine O-methyltransferase Ste14